MNMLKIKQIKIMIIIPIKFSQKKEKKKYSQHIYSKLLINYTQKISGFIKKIQLFIMMKIIKLIIMI